MEVEHHRVNTGLRHYRLYLSQEPLKGLVRDETSGNRAGRDDRYQFEAGVIANGADNSADNRVSSGQSLKLISGENSVRSELRQTSLVRSECVGFVRKA